MQGVEDGSRTRSGLQLPAPSSWALSPCPVPSGTVPAAGPGTGTGPALLPVAPGTAPARLRAGTGGWDPPALPGGTGERAPGPGQLSQLLPTSGSAARASLRPSSHLGNVSLTITAGRTILCYLQLKYCIDTNRLWQALQEVFN